MPDYKSIFFHLNVCVIRMPVLSLHPNELYVQNELGNKEDIIKGIKSIIQKPELKKALFVSYNDFHNEVERVLADHKNIQLNKLLRIYLSLYKFLSRISFRTTPLGLFSGIALAKISDDPPDLHFNKSSLTIDVQPYLNEFSRLILEIEFDFLKKNHIKFQLNPSLYELDGNYYFIEKDYIHSSKSTLVKIDKTPILSEIILACKEEVTLSKLIECISRIDHSLSKENIQKYLKKLIDSQLILSELFPNPNGRNFSVEVQANLKRILEDAPKVKSYLNFVSGLAACNRDKDYKDLKKFIDDNPGFKYTLDTRITNKHLVIPTKLIDSISQQCFELFTKILPRNAPNLEIFIHKFQNRYDKAEVPLLESLDSNYGVGYAESTIGNSEYQPLKNGMNFNRVDGAEEKKNHLTDLIERVFFTFHNKKNNRIDIQQEIEALPPIDGSSRPLNESAYIFGKLVTYENLEGYHLITSQIYAGQASKLLKRFGSLGKDIENLVGDIYEREQYTNPNVILAEVTNCPSNDHANLVLSTTSRKYELSYYSGKSKSARTIGLNDLLIRIVDGNIRLWSRQLKKEVIPVISHTYNTYLDDPIYKFLSDVANQKTWGGKFWNWGRYLKSSHLPRITYKNIILSREQWFLKQRKIDFNDVEKADKLIQEILIANSITQRVFMAEGIGNDNELFLDLSIRASRLIVAKSLNKKNIYLFEDVISGNKFISDNEGKHYSTDVIIPYINKKPKFPALKTKKNESHEERFFLPSDDWLYLKIYAGSKLAEKILTEIVLPFCEEMTYKQVVSKWFFIKYFDSDYHLRLRLRRSKWCNNDEWNLVLNYFNSAVKNNLESAFSFRIMVDSYIREVERYGCIQMHHSEDFFHIDSVCIAKFLKDIYGNEGEHYRYKFALLNINELLNSFDYSLEEKLRLLSNLETDFFNEFKMNFIEEKPLKLFLDNRYRELRPVINDTLDSSSAIFKEISPYLNPRAIFFENNKKHYLDKRDNLIYSYIHMSLNRLFLINPREHELIIYALLSKYYKSLIARKKHEKIEPSFSGNI